MDWEYKSMAFTPTAVQDRTVTGVFAVFGNRDLKHDVAHPGSFLKTFQEAGKRALYLWHHEAAAPPIAVISDLQEIPRELLPDDVRAEYPEATGGATVTRTYLDTPRGNEVLTAIKGGAPLLQSYGFLPVKYERKAAADGVAERHLYEQRLGEVSDVGLLAVNPATRARKALTDWDAWLAEVVAEFAEYLEDVKAGRRHSAADQTRLDAMHDHVVALGATNCPGSPAAEAKAADPPALDMDALSRAADLSALTPLADAKARLNQLLLACATME